MTTPVSKVPFVGPTYARRLEKLEIFTVRDLLYHLPFRYDDFSLIVKANSLQEGEVVTVSGKVLEMKNEFTRGGFVLQKATITDETGTAEALWFNQRFLPRVIRKGDLVSLSGKVKRNGRKLQLEAPQYEIGAGRVHTGRLVPIYPETAGVTSKWLRSRLFGLLSQIKIEDYLPEQIKKENNLLDLETAISKVHFPDNLAQAEAARRRLAFDELLAAQLLARRRKEEWKKKTVGNKFKIIEIRDRLATFVDHLPFTLTTGQKNVVNEIYQDLTKDRPMNRLLQGDVGSGKTVVAALVMLAAYLNGFQSVLMAPTEILAEQHYETLLKLLKPLKIGVGIATGSKKDYANYDIVVGTHALLSDKLNFQKLGLIVIDEQHRFGVEQRAKLTEKGLNPHVLTMTATPIPRTVALALYGDLDISYLSEMPKNRLPVKTWVVPNEKREAAYNWIRAQKTPTFIICPLIEESETLQSVKSAKKEFETLSKEIFPDLSLGLLHGRMKTIEKNQVLEQFKKGELDVLVATPVVEVGIDIPKATVMVIEGADRFGLAQLHQLRGRVGRSDQQSYCLLFTENDDGIRRLKFLEKMAGGRELAEADLKYRGPGQRFGTAQHGRWDLKIADFSDSELVEKVKKVADQFPYLRPDVEISRIKT